MATSPVSRASLRKFATDIRKRVAVDAGPIGARKPTGPPLTLGAADGACRRSRQVLAIPSYFAIPVASLSIFCAQPTARTASERATVAV